MCFFNSPLICSTRNILESFLVRDILGYIPPHQASAFTMRLHLKALIFRSSFSILLPQFLIIKVTADEPWTQFLYLQIQSLTTSRGKRLEFIITPLENVILSVKKRSPHCILNAAQLGGRQQQQLKRQL